jgi:hypothetical protein
MVVVHIAVKIPPGAESKVSVDWDKNEQELIKRCKMCKLFDGKTRIEFLKVEVDV